MGSLSLLQGIFPTQGSNPSLLHCRWILYHLSHQGIPHLVVSDSLQPMDYTVHGILQARILEWVAISFSRESPQPRDWTQVSCIAGGFFTSWATIFINFYIDHGSITRLPRGPLCYWHSDTKIPIFPLCRGKPISPWLLGLVILGRTETSLSEGLLSKIMPDIKSFA